MKITKGKSIVWVIFAILTLIALGFRVTTSSSFAQPVERKTPEVTETPVAYPPPVGDSGANIQSSNSAHPYPPPITDNGNNVLAGDFGSPPQSDISITVNALYLPYKVRLPTIASRNYDRQAAVNYADTWAHGRNPNFPDYGSEDGCNDCTNYLSQMLLAGGRQQIFLYGDTSFDWWYYCDEYSVCNSSHTWSATDWMNSFAANYDGVLFGPSPDGWVTGLSEGDFFLMDLLTSPQHGIPNHARLVVGWGYPEEGDNFSVWSLLVNQHCTDRKRVRWDYNINVDVTRIWVWHVQ